MMDMGSGGLNRVLNQMDQSIQNFQSTPKSEQAFQKYESKFHDYHKVVEQFQKNVETPHKDLDQVLLQRVLDKLHNMPQHLAQSKAATEMAGHVVNSFQSSMRRLKKDLEHIRRRIPLKSENVKQVQRGDTDTRTGG